MIQLRPSDGTDARFYSPHRDLAHLGLPLLRRVFDRLAATAWTPWLAWFADSNGVTEERLGRCAAAVAKLFNAVPDPDTADYDQAWADSGMAALERTEPEVVHAFFVVLGRAVLPLMFNGMRETTSLADPSFGRNTDEFIDRAAALMAWGTTPRWIRAAARVLPAAWTAALVRRHRRREQARLASALKIHRMVEESDPPDVA